MHTPRQQSQHVGHKAPLHPHRPHEGLHGEPVSWHTVLWVVLGSMMGVGILSMPAAYQRLGWLPASACIAAFAVAACYAGVLYTRVMSELPWISSYHELGHKMAGRWGVLLVSCTAYVGVFSAPIIMHLASTQALQQLFSQDMRPPLLLSGFAIACAMMPLSQLRRLADIGWVGAAGSCLMVLAMAVLVYKLVMVEPAPEGGAVTHMLEHQPLLIATVGVMDIMFAFSGQVNWPRFLSAMGPHRRQFSISASVALSVLTPIVFVVGAIGYERQGGHIDLTDPINKHLRPDRWSLLVNAGVLAAVLVAYVLDLNVAAQVLLEMIHPQLFKPGHGHTVGSRIHSPGMHIHSTHVHHHPRTRHTTAPERQPLLGPQHAGHAYEPASAMTVDEETALASEQVPPYIPPITSSMPPPAPRTISEAEKALGTGVVFPALEQELHTSEEATNQGTAATEGTSAPTVQARWQHAVDLATGATQQAGMAAQAGSKPHGEAVSLQLHVEPEGIEEAGDAVGVVTRLVLHTEHGHASNTAGTRSPKVSQATAHQQQDDWAMRHPHNDIGTVRMLWALTTISFILASWMVGYIWPSIAELEGIIGSLAGTSSIFLLPALFALRLTHLPKHERVLCFVLCAASLGVTGLGLYASIVRLIRSDKSRS